MACMVERRELEQKMLFKLSRSRKGRTGSGRGDNPLGSGGLEGQQVSDFHTQAAVQSALAAAAAAAHKSPL